MGDVVTFILENHLDQIADLERGVRAYVNDLNPDGDDYDFDQGVIGVFSVFAYSLVYGTSPVQDHYRAMIGGLIQRGQTLLETQIEP